MAECSPIAEPWPVPTRSSFSLAGADTGRKWAN